MVTEEAGTDEATCTDSGHDWHAVPAADSTPEVPGPQSLHNEEGEEARS